MAVESIPVSRNVSFRFRLGCDLEAVRPMTNMIRTFLQEQHATPQEIQAVELSMLLCLPAALALAVAAGPLIAALFQGGRFTAEDAAITGEIKAGEGTLQFGASDNEDLLPIQPTKVLGSYIMPMGYKLLGMRVVHDYLNP